MLYAVAAFDTSWGAEALYGCLCCILFSVMCCFFFFSSRRRHTRCSRDWSSDVCSSDLLLLGILREEKCFGSEILMERGLRLSTLREELARTSGEKTAAARPKETSLLAEFSRDLTQAAGEGSLDPLVGRENEVERVIQILCRRTKNNPVLIGEPGVGKTAIVEGLAQRIADGDVPPFLADKRILSLDLSLIVAGTKYRGQFEIGRAHV